jgi:cell division protein FtsB
LTISFLVVNNIKISHRREKLAVQIKALENKIQQAEKRKGELKNIISQARSKENIEKAARDQLGLKKPGEEVVVVKKKKKEADKENKEKNKGWWELIKSIFNR